MHVQLRTEAEKPDAVKIILNSVWQELSASQDEVEKLKEKEQTLRKEMEKRSEELQDKREAAKLKVCKIEASYEALNEEMDRKEADGARSRWST